MKYMSEITGKIYDSVEALTKAENEAKVEAEKVEAAKRAIEKHKSELKAQRETRAKEVEDAFIAVRDAEKKANKLLNAFCKDYGSFHTSIKDADMSPFDSLFDLFF